MYIYIHTMFIIYIYYVCVYIYNVQRDLLDILRASWKNSFLSMIQLKLGWVPGLAHGSKPCQNQSVRANVE